MPKIRYSCEDVHPGDISSRELPTTEVTPCHKCESFLLSEGKENTVFFFLFLP